jgi:hypothetical protein
LGGCLPSGLVPFSDDVCIDTSSLSPPAAAAALASSGGRVACTPYQLEHIDALNGVRNQNTRVRTYCNPSAYPPYVPRYCTPKYCAPPAVSSSPSSSSAPLNFNNAPAAAPRSVLAQILQLQQQQAAALLQQQRALSVQAFAGPAAAAATPRPHIDISGPFSYSLSSLPVFDRASRTVVTISNTRATAEPANLPFCPQIPQEVEDIALAQYPPGLAVVLRNSVAGGTHYDLRTFEQI